MHFSSSVLTCYCRFDGFYRRTEGSLWQCLGCPASFLTSRGMRRHLGIFRWDSDKWRDREIAVCISAVCSCGLGEKKSDWAARQVRTAVLFSVLTSLPQVYAPYYRREGELWACRACPASYQQYSCLRIHLKVRSFHFSDFYSSLLFRRQPAALVRRPVIIFYLATPNLQCDLTQPCCPVCPVSVRYLRNKCWLT